MGVGRPPRANLRQMPRNVESISSDLEKICAHLESITGSLARLVALAERVETAVTTPVRIIRRIL
jgi:hypothetical protein